jgi:phosphatidylglycerol:prolipoprotein diacylglycerol transferase
VQFPGQAAQSCGQALGEICARHPSQLYEALLEGLLLGAVLMWLAFRRDALKAPGRIVGLFIGGYGAARFFVEFFRQPDAQFVSDGNPLGLAWQIGGYGLTMGQFLSVPMILIGLYLWATARRA